MSGDPTCVACGQLYWLQNGCRTPFMAHTYVHGSEPIVAELADEDGMAPLEWVSPRCGDCAVRVGERHHSMCSQAYCLRTGEQMLMCECESCAEGCEMAYLAGLAERGEIDWEARR